jgi:hypothetical protein
MGDVAALVALPWRAVGYTLFQLVQSGTVTCLEGGTYTLAEGIHLASQAGTCGVEPLRPSRLALAWEALWQRTVGGSFDRLPDPAKHPECWFKIV